jgi:cytochrome o ubiquinol oxidase subunit II
MIRFTKRAGLFGASALVIAALSGCERGVLDPAGPVGAAERKILFDTVAIMLLIVIPVMDQLLRMQM